MKKLIYILPLALILCIMVGCRDKEAMAELETMKAQAAVEEQNKEIIRRWIEEVSKENFEQLFNELWAGDCLQYMNSNPEPIDNKQYKQMIEHYYSNFPGSTHAIHNIIAKEDKVIAMFTARTTHDMESYGVPATGKELAWRAIAIFQISDGKIQTRWEVADILTMYEQLGMELKPKEGE